MKESQTDSEKQRVTPNQNSNLILQELVNECITDVIWEMDLARQKFTYVSPAVYRLRGFTVEEAMQEELHQSLHEDDYHYITNHLPPRISHYENGDESFRILTGEFRQPRKDGSFADVEITTILLKNSLGKVDRIAGVTREIKKTRQRKRAEEIIKLLNADLKLKNREMEQLIYITSHDLRSPLVNIKGFNNELQYSLKQYKDLHNDFGSALLTEKASLIEKDINESIEYINISIDKMDRLLKGLLGYSRLGRMIRIPAQIFMNNLVADVIKTNEYQLKNSHIVIEISDLPSCWASEQMINQAFSNLLSNAINYRDDNKKGFIKISGEQSDNLVTYCIEDNGIGIEPQHQEKVFELFYRLNPQKGEGEGLGLPTVKKIIELNAGKIRLESEPGKGSKFFVTLPAESSVQNPELTD
ncbi:MAG: GHKL domain-containing protein [Bacteroidetes bacterium]|nr:MAG: GHKL domain-containing protein [Bacteroidota bacterium]